MCALGRFVGKWRGGQTNWTTLLSGWNGLANAQAQFEIINSVQRVSQHEIMNLRLFMLCVKIRKYETFSIRSNSAMRNGP